MKPNDTDTPETLPLSPEDEAAMQAEMSLRSNRTARSHRLAYSPRCARTSSMRYAPTRTHANCSARSPNVGPSRQAVTGRSTVPRTAMTRLVARASHEPQA